VSSQDSPLILKKTEFKTRSDPEFKFTQRQPPKNFQNSNGTLGLEFISDPEFIRRHKKENPRIHLRLLFVFN
jgi:hypothetical protein